MVLVRGNALLELLLSAILASVISATSIKMSVFLAALPATMDLTGFAVHVPSLALLALPLLRLAFPAPLVSIMTQLREPVMLFLIATTARSKFKESAPAFALPTGISTRLPVSVLVPAATSRMVLAAASSPLPPTSAPSLSSCKETPVWLSVKLVSTPTQRLAPACPAHPLARLAFLLITV